LARFIGMRATINSILLDTMFDLPSLALFAESSAKPRRVPTAGPRAAAVSRPLRPG
jgi:hypothetical protein